MISIVICSRSNDISLSLSNSISATIGVDYELIIIDNSNNQYSIFQAYNMGVCKAKYPYLCFLHEDVEFLEDSLGWGKLLEKKLSCEKTGIVGLAGSDIITRIPASWSFHKAAQKINIVQGKKDGSGNFSFEYKRLPYNYKESFSPVFLLDGLFLAVRKQLFDKIRFDENFSGFHGYDFDISLQSYFSGYENYVMYDKIVLKHFSSGNRDRKYYENLIKVFNKHEKNLSILFEENKKKWHNLCAIERKRLRRFCMSLLKKNFSIKEVILFFKYYSNIIKLPNSVYCILLMYLFVYSLFSQK